METDANNPQQMPHDGTHSHAGSAHDKYPFMPPEVYFKHRDCLNEIESKSAEHHDKAILQLAVAALGVSVTFIEKIATNPTPCSLVVLYFGWGALIVSVIALLGSFHTAQRDVRYERDMLDKEFHHQKEFKRTRKYARRTVCLNQIAYGTFTVGIILIVIFSALNLSKKHEEEEKEKQMRANQNNAAITNNETTRGAVTPTAPVAPVTASPAPPAAPTPAAPTTTTSNP